MRKILSLFFLLFVLFDFAFSNGQFNAVEYDLDKLAHESASSQFSSQNLAAGKPLSFIRSRDLFPPSSFFDSSSSTTPSRSSDSSFSSSFQLKWDAGRPLSYLLKVLPPRRLRLPIDFHVLFVGFKGDGRGQLKIAEELVQKFFEHIEQPVDHLVAPVGEHQTTTGRFDSPKTGLEFAVAVHAVELSPLVTTLLEDILIWLMRPERSADKSAVDQMKEKKQKKQKAAAAAAAAASSADEDFSLNGDDDDDAGMGVCSVEPSVFGDPKLHLERHFVDAEQFAGVLQSLLDALGLSTANTLFILNPKAVVDRDMAEYGYRVGMSDTEAKRLLQSPARVKQMLADLQSTADSSKANKKSRKSETASAASAASGGTGAAGHAGDRQLKYTNFSEISEEWARQVIQEQFRVIDEKKKEDRSNIVQLCSGQLSSTQTAAACLYARTPGGSKSAAVDVARDITAFGSRRERDRLEALLRRRTLDSQEQHTAECLVDTWVSRKRLSWLDLAAGPFEWGPTIGATGIKTFFSLPDIPEAIFSAYQRHKAEKADNAGAAAERNAQGERFTSDNQIARELELMEIYFNRKCSGDVAAEEDVSVTRSAASLGSMSTSLRHEACRALARDMQLLRSEPSQLRPFFTAHEGPGGGHDDFIAEVDRPRDSFLAHLSSAVSRHVRQVLLPPVPLFELNYRPRVSFHTYILLAHGSPSSAYNPLDYYQYDVFKREMNKLKLPEQEFQFTLSLLRLLPPEADGSASSFSSSSSASEHRFDPALSAAYALSLRTAVLPTLSTRGDFGPERIRYLDAALLQRELSAISLDHSSADPNYHRVSDAEVHLPIFLFSVDEGQPLFVDRYYTAKAMDSMIIGTQSPVALHHGQQSSRVSCNGESVPLDMLNPVRSILSATALRLAGLLPAHVGYQTAQRAAFQDWLWAASDSPLSSLSAHGHSFGERERDTAWRNYATADLSRARQSLLAASRRLNEVRLPEQEKLSPELLHSLSPLFRRIQVTYNETLSHMQSAALSFQDNEQLSKAVKQSNLAEHASREFEEAVDEALRELQVQRCTYDDSLLSRMAEGLSSRFDEDDDDNQPGHADFMSISATIWLLYAIIICYGVTLCFVKPKKRRKFQ